MKGLRVGFVTLTVLLLALIAVSIVSAQTATAPPPPTPDTNQYWLLPTRVNDLGTPQAPQWAAFAYSLDSGDVAILLFHAGLLFTLWAGIVIWLLIRRRESKSLGGGR